MLHDKVALHESYTEQPLKHIACLVRTPSDKWQVTSPKALQLTRVIRKQCKHNYSDYCLPEGGGLHSDTPALRTFPWVSLNTQLLTWSGRYTMSMAVALEEIVFRLSGCKIGFGHLFCYVNQREKQIKECNTVRHEEPNSATATCWSTAVQKKGCT